MFHTITRNLSKPLSGLVLRLVDLVLISGLLCIVHHPINFGLRQFPFHHDTLTDPGLDAIVYGAFDETWNSSMMFSSTLTVVQSSGPSDDSYGLASSRALVRGLALCSLHFEAPSLKLLHILLPLTPVNTCCLLGLRHPASHGSRFQLGLSSRAPPDVQQTSSINTVQLVMARIHHDVLNRASASTWPL